MNSEKHKYEFLNSYLCFSEFIVMLKTGLLPNNEWLNSYVVFLTCYFFLTVTRFYLIPNYT